MDFSKFSKNANFESLTVQVSQEEAPFISTTSNDGNIKLNAKACKVLAVPYGLVNTNHKSEAGVRIGFRTQTWAGEKNQIVAFLYPVGSKQGVKLASPNNQNGGILQCSSANAWNTLKGNSEKLMIYSIADEDNAVLFSKDETEIITYKQAEEAGLIANGLWTEAGVQYGLYTAEEVGTKPVVYFRMTFVRDEPKREVAPSQKQGRPKADKKAKTEVPGTNTFADDEEEVASDENDGNQEFL